MIKITLFVDQDDYNRFVKYLRYKISGALPRKCWRTSLKNISVWFVISFVFFYVTNYRIDIHWQSVVFVLFFILMFVGFFVFYYKKIVRDSRPNPDGVVLGNKAVELNEDGVIEEGVSSKSFYSWSLVETVDENNGDLYIFVDRVIAVIIPSSAFGSDEDRVEVVNFVNSRKAKETARA